MLFLLFNAAACLAIVAWTAFAQPPAVMAAAAGFAAAFAANYRRTD